ncbi:MAG TPA: phosphoadenosine phosphosulfate reductase family protein [Epulopiscium sp.]|nr:phosphoadenosine phosphosulfate reductase family protein [Candidatus Epulonipiscium sp.]
MELWQLQQLQGLPLEVKIRKTQERIKEWYEHWNGQAYISFSGGKDSTVLLDLVRGLYPDVEAVFIDTGLEYPEIKNFVRAFDNVKCFRPSKTFRQVIDEYGYPVVSKEVADCVQGARKGQQYRIDRLNGTLKDNHGNKSMFNQEKWKFLLDAPFKISHQCCAVMKKQPIYRFEKETSKKPFIGMMADESRLRKQLWLKNGCNAFNNKRPSSNPISFWTEQDILQYIKRFNLHYCSVYGEIKTEDEIQGQMCLEGMAHDLITTGVKGTGCMFCMFGVHLEKEPNRFQMMKETHPKQYNYCINKLGIGKVLDYINIKY